MTITTLELIHLNPNEIEIEDNVRLDPRLDRDFLASIEEHGVLVPVLAVRIDGQDKPFVRQAQGRIQAARRGRATCGHFAAQPGKRN
jgi:ParB family transcriptional regulator, chromosome partitioning protein